MVLLSFSFPWRVVAFCSDWVLAASPLFFSPFFGRGWGVQKALRCLMKEDLALLNQLNTREQAACEHILVSVV